MAIYIGQGGVEVVVGEVEIEVGGEVKERFQVVVVGEEREIRGKFQ